MYEKKTLETTTGRFDGVRDEKGDEELTHLADSFNLDDFQSYST